MEGKTEGEEGREAESPISQRAIDTDQPACLQECSEEPQSLKPPPHPVEEGYQGQEFENCCICSPLDSCFALTHEVPQQVSHFNFV